MSVDAIWPFVCGLVIGLIGGMYFLLKMQSIGDEDEERDRLEDGK